MNDRKELIAYLRSEIVGPSRPVRNGATVEVKDNSFSDPNSLERKQLFWKDANGIAQEILYFERESPHRKYGMGLLHPMGVEALTSVEAASIAADTLGVEVQALGEDDDAVTSMGIEAISGNDDSDEIDLSNSDVRMPSSLGVSLFAEMETGGEIHLSLPTKRLFYWQAEGDEPYQVNGIYRTCDRHWMDGDGNLRVDACWRRFGISQADILISVSLGELVDRQIVKRDVPNLIDPNLKLSFLLYPRDYGDGRWLLTIVLKNESTVSHGTEAKELTLYQSLFEVALHNGSFLGYPEGLAGRPSEDEEERSLKLLYRESINWAIGHNCAAGWDSSLNTTPQSIFSDVLPAVELPSMTPDVEVNGAPLKVGMRELFELDEEGLSDGWKALEALLNGYEQWIAEQQRDLVNIPTSLRNVGAANIRACTDCLNRMKGGLERLKHDATCREAFRLSNLSMLLQQVATKQIQRRELGWNAAMHAVIPNGDYLDPWSIVATNLEDRSRIGSWRAFQIGFFLLSIEGIYNPTSDERGIVDLIWFPTGGGKTEAYLGVIAFYLYYQRLAHEDCSYNGLRTDGTAVLMRYTLRMLTTQQFQRAASLVCAMEYVRRNHDSMDLPSIPGDRFSLGLWIGGEGSPNKVEEAKRQVRKFQNADDSEGNPLILTECPWCKAEIGRYSGPKPPRVRANDWKHISMKGLSTDARNDPVLLCPDSKCAYGQESSETWLPIEVIDERIYARPPSFVISTADKLAMVAYRPEAGSLFGMHHGGGEPQRISLPPGLIVQDELHLISGPLGTMYALYEGVFEKLCSYEDEARSTTVKPKLVASTATIRGASSQVRALYARETTNLFPPPALTMGDSFFGRYARSENGQLLSGRLYLGVLGANYGSNLTAQVRAFASLLFRAWELEESHRDPWWTLLAFYNSIRELGGARTLFDSDIRSRLKFLFNREGFPNTDRRTLRIVEELTSRLSQSHIVKRMDQLSRAYEDVTEFERVDACLASSIIEVGVDIDRLSLMAVVGQPKSTASYIQVTGRVGRRWWDRPGLILTLYSPSKSRDRSHFEQFQSYHRRLYEMVEPTSATPFAVSAIDRGLSGALILFARQLCSSPVSSRASYERFVNEAFDLLKDRCEKIQNTTDATKSIAEMSRTRAELITKWGSNPQQWEEFPPKSDGDYLILWPGQFATELQKNNGVVIPTSMRQVDASGELEITQGYALHRTEDS